MPGVKLKETVARVPLGERHKSWWQRGVAAGRGGSKKKKKKKKPSRRLPKHSHGEKPRVIPEIDSLPRNLVVRNVRRVGGETKRRAASAGRVRRIGGATAAPPFASRITGRQVPCRTPATRLPRHGETIGDTNAAVFRTTTSHYRKTMAKQKSTPALKTTSSKSNSYATPISPNAIVRRHSSQRGIGTRLASSSTRASATMSPSDKIRSSATLTGPYTRSDPKVYGATNSTYHPNARFAKSQNPNDAAIYAVQTSPRAEPMSAVERGRIQYPSKQLPKPVASGDWKAAVEFGRSLRGVADRLPTPAPESLDMVAPSLQKAVLWPDAAAERQHWPDRKISNLGGLTANLAGKLRGTPTFAPTRLSQAEFVSRLGRACRLGDTEVVASLLDERHALDWLNLPGEDGATALHEAAAGGSVEVVQDLLLPSGADPTIEAGYLGTPLDVARDRLARIIRTAPVNRRREQEPDAQLLVCLLQTTNIWQASLEGDLGRVRHLLDFEGADVDSRNPYGCTALHYACMGGMPQVIELLLERGAFVHAKNKIGQTPEDVSKEEWVVTMLHRESRERKERKRKAKERARAIASIRDAQEQADRDAWMSARGTSSAVPLAKRLQEHAKRGRAASRKRTGTSQKRGVFTAPSNPGRYLHARPGSAHNTTAIVRRALPSDRIVDPGKNALQGTSRLRHVRRLSHGMDSPSVVFDQFWRWDRSQAKAKGRGKTRPSSAKHVRRKGGNTGHPSPGSQEFAEWLRLHFGTAVPMQGAPMR